MGKTPPPFSIHVDSSCLTDSTDLEQPKQRDASSDTIVHNPPADDSRQTDKQAAEQELLDEKIQAQIHEAARKVVADYERSRQDQQEESILSSRTDESYRGEGTEVTYDGTELTYDGSDATYETDREEHTIDDGNELDSQIDQALDEWEADDSHAEDEQDSSSHPGDDDVFSENSGRSQRSSLNSVHDLTSSDEAYAKRLPSPQIGEEASSIEESVSRIPSMASYTPEESIVYTPSRVKQRPPFRTPSSVRAMQMTSPTPSIFASPRSAKRHHPTGSRLGTPTSQYSPSKRTPTRFKAKKEEPLNLLHVTVMPIQWPYSDAMNVRDVPESLQFIKENWRLLFDKLADTVLERGILLPHPQESYEVLEERLLEALELPVRPRATILKCGHYMGPLDIESPSSDDESMIEQKSYFQGDSSMGRKWCDICRKDVKLENTGESCGKRRFNVKIFAGNGLMRAGAWAAAWREMERVDVEIEPWVDAHVRTELEEFAASIPAQVGDEEDGFVDEEDEVEEAVEKALEEVEQKLDELESLRQSAEEKEIIREFEEEERKHRIVQEENLQNLLAEEKALQEKVEREEESRRRTMEEEKIQAIMARPSSRVSNTEGANHSRRTTLSEDRMREIYGPSSTPPPPITEEHYTHDQDHLRPRHRHQAHPTIDPDSLPDLLFAAFKVVLRDKKNIAIGFLSILVLLLALKPHTTPTTLHAVEPSATLVNVPVAEVMVVEPQNAGGVTNEAVKYEEKKEDRISYVTVTSTSTSVRTVEAEPVVVTMTKEVLREASSPDASVAIEGSQPAVKVKVENLKADQSSEGDVLIDNKTEDESEEVQAEEAHKQDLLEPLEHSPNSELVQEVDGDLADKLVEQHVPGTGEAVGEEIS